MPFFYYCWSLYVAMAISLGTAEKFRCQQRKIAGNVGSQDRGQPSQDGHKSEGIG
jgi:hypothetical protein